MHELLSIKTFVHDYRVLIFEELLVFLSIMCFVALNNIQWVQGFLKTYHKKGLLITLCLITAICFITFKNFLLFKIAYFFYEINDDGYVTMLPKLYNIANSIARYGLPTWSFRVGMGQNIFPFVLLDPFAIIFYFTGAEHVQSLIVYEEVLKIILTGLVFFMYLKRLRLAVYSCIIGALLFSFNGFIIVGNPFLVFTIEAFNLALLLLAFELLYAWKKWHLFSMTVFMVCICMSFDLYPYVLFLATYSTFRYLQSENMDVKKLGGLYMQMVGLAIIGILMSGPFLLENINLLLSSPRGSGLTSYTNKLTAYPKFGLPDHLQLGTSIMRFFSNDLLGSGSNFKGWFDFIEAPMIYCGLPCLLLVPQLFVFLKKRQRIVFGLFFVLWFIPMVFPYFRYAFWLFAGDYYRIYGLFVLTIMIGYSVTALNYIFKERRVNIPLLLVTLLALILILCFPPFIDKSIIENSIRVFCIDLLVMYTIIFMLLGKVSVQYLKFAFLATLVFELCYSVSITNNKRGAYTPTQLKTILYNDASKDAINFIRQNDTTFYRVDRYLDLSGILNFGMMQKYNGTSSYSSFNQLYYIKYLQLMGVARKNNERDSRWTVGLLNNPILQSENRVKYFLVKRDTIHLSPVMWDSIAVREDIKVYRNKFVLPFGFTYRNYLKESVFDPLSAVQKERLTLKAFVVNDKNEQQVATLKEYRLADTMPPPVDFSGYEHDFKALSEDTLQLTQFTDINIAGTINASADKMLYLSIPYDDGWRLEVDGKPQDKILIDGGMTGVLLSKGNHTIALAYKLRFGWVGILMSGVGFILFAVLGIYLKRRNARA